MSKPERIMVDATYEKVVSEIAASGVVEVEIVLRGSKEWELADAMTIGRGLTCDRHPDVPAGFVSVCARNGTSVGMTAPICDACVATVGEAIEKTFRNVEIHYCEGGLP
jgi:hypothetical protein